MFVECGVVIYIEQCNLLPTQFTAFAKSFEVSWWALNQHLFIVCGSNKVKSSLKLPDQASRVQKFYGFYDGIEILIFTIFIIFSQDVATSAS